VIRLKLYLLEIAYRELLDKECAAGEASQAAAGMLAPLGDEPPDQEHPLQQLGMSALSYYDGLDEQEHILLKGVPSDGLVVRDSELLG